MTTKKNSYVSNLATYKVMEQDAIISGALELWASDATQVSSDKSHSVWIECSNSNLKEELEDFLYSTVNVETKLFPWAYRIARDGQIFIRTFDGTSGSDWSFETIRDNERVYPLIKKGKITNYYYENKDGDGFIYPSDEFIPFIASLDEEYEKIILDSKDGTGRKFEYDCVHGESFLRGSVIAWKVLSTLEDVLIVTRVGKSSVFNLVKVEVGNASKKGADIVLEKAKKVFKTTEAIDLVSVS